MRDKRGFTQTEIIGLILVVLVIGAVLIFIYKENILGWMRNLPGYSIPEKDEEIDVSRESEEKVDVCIINAFWAENLKKIKKGEEIKPGEIQLTLEIDNIDKCNHDIVVDEGMGNTASMAINKDILTNTIWKKQNNFYYILYQVKDSGWGRSGKYSFNIYDKENKLFFKGYEIIVEN